MTATLAARAQAAAARVMDAEVHTVPADERGRLDRELTAAQTELRARVAALADNATPTPVAGGAA